MLTTADNALLEALIQDWSELSRRLDLPAPAATVYKICVGELRLWQARVNAESQIIPMCSLGVDGCCHRDVSPDCNCPCHTQTTRATGALPPPGHEHELGMSAEAIAKLRTILKEL